MKNLSFILLIFYAQEVLLLNPEVTLPSGKVRGYYDQTINGKQICAFEGIPYAKPPVGKHRFKVSLEVTNRQQCKLLIVQSTGITCIKYKKLQLGPAYEKMAPNLETMAPKLTPFQHYSDNISRTVNDRKDGGHRPTLCHNGAKLKYSPRSLGPRYKEAQPVKPWLGTWEANTLHKCMQYKHYAKPEDDRVIGSEDCLYVNVYTPDVHNTTLKDVIIHIHGGAFMFNHGGSYGHNIILDQNVVYVTLNYRLGPLGFLSTEDNIVPGNMGLKDQLLALKWIKANVVFFGGNPHSVTLTGMSAGGGSAQLHALSPLSQGLFHRGISQSGTALNAWILAENSLEKSKRLADHVGCPTTTSREMIDCLRYRSAYQIVHAVKVLQPWLYNPFSPFGVVIDKWSTTPFLPDHPYTLLRNKQIQDLPWIFSNVECEGLYPGADFIGDVQHLDNINTNWDSLMQHVLDFNYTVNPPDQLDVLQKIKNYYFQQQTVSNATFSNLVTLLSDRLFIADIERAARLHSAAVTSPVYYYYFSYRGAHSKSEHQSGTNENYGASHGDDTVYVLSSNVDTQSTENDKEMSRLLTDMWITFAATNVPQIGNTAWTPLAKETTTQLNLLVIQSPTNITNYVTPQLGHRDFWDTLPIKENKNLFIIKDEL